MPDSEGFPAIALSNGLTYLFAVMAALLPIWVIVFYCMQSKEWNSSDFMEKYGAPLSGVKTNRPDHKWIPVVSPVIFLARRLFFSITVVYYPEYLWL